MGYTTIILRKPQNSILGNYEGPYITSRFTADATRRTRRKDISGSTTWCSLLTEVPILIKLSMRRTIQLQSLEVAGHDKCHQEALLSLECPDSSVPDHANPPAYSWEWFGFRRIRRKDFRKAAIGHCKTNMAGISGTQHLNSLSCASGP